MFIEIVGIAYSTRSRMSFLSGLEKLDILKKKTLDWPKKLTAKLKNKTHNSRENSTRKNHCGGLVQFQSYAGGSATTMWCVVSNFENGRFWSKIWLMKVEFITHIINLVKSDRIESGMSIVFHFNTWLFFMFNFMRRPRLQIPERTL